MLVTTATRMRVTFTPLKTARFIITTSDLTAVLRKFLMKRAFTSATNTMKPAAIPTVKIGIPQL